LANGYRCVVRDLIPGVPLQGRPITDDYLGLSDDAVTPPSSSVDYPAGMWVSKNKHRMCFPSVFSYLFNDEGNLTPRISVVEVTWDEGDVLQTFDTGSAIQQGGLPDPPVSFVGYRVSSLVVGAELDYAEINEAALDVTLQEE
jgi:hypothetical protein